MLKLNEVLKASKGLYVDDSFAMLWGKQLGGWKVTELTGTLPITFRSNGTALIDYRIYGTADGAGVQTENLWNENYENISTGLTYKSINVGNGSFTLSTNTPLGVGGASLFLMPGQRSSGASTASYGAYDGSPRTVTSVDGYVTLVYRLYDNKDPRDYQTMLVKGSTPPETFIPYGYKLPLTLTSGTESKTTDIYIGDSKLGEIEYVDYGEQKIYKAKRIHEDTVTIDGIEWDILDYDRDEVYKADGTRAKHTVTIQTHDCINDLQYSARQAAFAFPNGLAAGAYKFTVGANPWVSGDVGKVLTFTIANAIPAGGQLVFNGAHNKTLVGTTISVFASATVATAAETVTMTEGDTGTDLGTMLRSKTDTVNSIDRAMRGSDNWLESAMRQYLNSDKAAGSVWSPQTVFDRPPAWASTTAGFLHGIDPDFVAVLGNVKKTTGLNNISDGGGTAVHDEKFFLLSRSEVYMGDEYTGGEGTPYAYYKNYSDNQSPSTGEDKNRIKYRAGVAKNWWLRSPDAGDAINVRLVFSSGRWNSGSTVGVHGVAPACCIVLDDMDDWVKQTFYTEVTADLPAIETFKGENTLDSTETVGEVTIKGRIKEAE